MTSPRLEKDIKRNPDRFLKDFIKESDKFSDKAEFQEKYVEWMRQDPKGIHVADYLDREILSDLWETYVERTGVTPSVVEPIMPRKERISYFVKGRKRSYVKLNIKVTEGFYKEKKAFYVYNIKAKKRITWGLKK